MATIYYKKEAKPSMFLSTERPKPPPPSTPYLTKKILTLVSSGGKNVGEGEPLPPSVSPSDSVARAMKNDLEELIGYIDNLAFNPTDEKAPAAATRVGTPSTNKELFPVDDHPSDTNYDKQTGDRTNGRL